MAETTENKPTPNPIVRTVNRLLRLFGVTFPKDVPVPSISKPKNPQITNFSYRELRHIEGFDSQTDPTIPTDAANISEYVQNITQKSGAWAREIKNIKSLTPEIDTAKDVAVSTILSPTDLQTDSIGIAVENSGLGAELEAELGKMLQDYFNDVYKLGQKSVKWIGEALFGEGASAILVLPEENIHIMNKAVDVELIKAGVDPNDHIVKKTHNDIKASSESLYASYEALANYDDDKLAALIDKVSFDCIEELSNEDGELKYIDKDGKPIKASMEAMSGAVKNIAELVNKNNHVIFTQDPTMIKATSNRLYTKMEEMVKDVDRHFLKTGSMPTYLTSTTRSGKEDEFVTTIRIPYQAVVPVTVPNAPEQHIGYFIMVDEWGTPLGPEYYDATAANGGLKLSEANAQAVYGKPNNLSPLGMFSRQNEFEMSSAIFGIMLRNMLDNKLEEFGLNGAATNYKETIGACLFRQILHKRRVGIVFVPEPLMVYIRYDHNENGTGKSLIQDIDILVALRNTLLVAGVMAATENSIDKKKIEVAVDEKNANVEQILNIVRNAFIEKNMLRFDNNPHTIQRDLVQKSLSIYPKNMRGLADSLNVTVDRATAGSIEPNDSLITKLSEWIVMHLIVPEAAMSQTGENEYSRSVATTNLIFNNKIKLLQSETTPNLTKLVQLYSYYSGEVKQKIEDILKASDVKHKTKREITYDTENLKDISDIETDDDTEEVEEKREHTIIKPVIKQDFKKNTKSIKENVDLVINSMVVKLPAPRIVVDKAHFEEIQAYISTLDNILQAIYPDEMTMGLDGYSDTLRMIRAMVKEAMIREYVKTIGFQSTYAIPSITDVVSTNTEEVLLHLINVKKGMVEINDHIGKRVIKDDSSMSGGYGGDNYDSGGGFGEESNYGEESSFGEEGDQEGGDQLETEPDELTEPERAEPSEPPTGDTSMPGGSLT